MSIKTWYLFIAILLLSVASPTFSKPKPTSTPKPKPLQIQTDENLGFIISSRDETLHAITKVGLIPPTLPKEFEGREDVKAKLQELVTAYLAKAGMEVVQPTTYQAAYDRLNKQLGGVYDPNTGIYKSELGNSLISNAMREFIEKEHLDGLVYFGIKMVEARFFHSDAFWDGIFESTTGQRPRGEIVKFIIGDSNSNGTLPAYSVLVQLTNSQGKIIYGRRGGIQLNNYFDPSRSPKGSNGFLYVPRDNLFRDYVRLERAVRIATQPLIFTPTQIAAGEKDPSVNPASAKPAELPPLPEGKPRQYSSPFLVPRDQILSRVHRVLITPLYIGNYSVPQEVQDRYVALITSELQKLHLEIIQAPDALNLLNTELHKAGGLFNPLTGKLDEDRIHSIRKKTIQSLNINPAPDAIIWPTLTRVTASRTNNIARWDGVTQDAVTLRDAKKRIWDNSKPDRAGDIGALSLAIQLRDLEDSTLYQSRGGIQLTQHLLNSPVYLNQYRSYSQQLEEMEFANKLADIAPDELFKDQTREQPAVHVALRNLVLTPEELEKELQPPGQILAKSKTKKRKPSD